MEWLRELFGGNVFAVVMAVSGFMGCLSRAVISAGLGKLYIQSESFGTSSDVFLKKIRLRYENSIRLGMKAGNTEAFVRRQLEKFRYLNLAVNDYDRITWISVLLCVMLALVGSVYSQNIWFMAYGGACAMAVVCVDKIENVYERREQIVLNLVDYFDNIASVGKRSMETSRREHFKEAVPEEHVQTEYGTKITDNIPVSVDTGITDAQRALIEQVLKEYLT